MIRKVILWLAKDEIDKLHREQMDTMQSLLRTFLETLPANRELEWPLSAEGCESLTRMSERLGVPRTFVPKVDHLRTGFYL